MLKLFMLDLTILLLEMVVACCIGFTLFTHYYELNALIITLSVASMVVWMVLLFTTLVSMSDHLRG